MKNTLQLLSILVISMTHLLTQSCKKEDTPPPPEPIPAASTTVKDIDGNLYHTVTIGTQVWMVENLKVTHDRNGNPIAHITDNAQWSNTSSGAWCNYNNNGLLADTYGRLYNWYAVADGGMIAPEGWHIPNVNEWQTLFDYLGGNTSAGFKLLEVGTAHWNVAQTGVTNESGFTALPGGMRQSGGTFGTLGSLVIWWSATEANATEANNFLIMDASLIESNNYSKKTGMSVRCIKD